ncbi:hypothetical protein GF343_05070 [Candidatus Woesearchaeota archaeon]|nr:hypothetical protein [Candidatus Woesearchaeota archaeon]
MAGKRLRIAVDCDEPLADCNTCLQAWHNRTYETNLTVDDIFSFKLWLVWECSKEESDRRVYEFYESEDFRNMQPTPGAAEGVAAIAEDNDPFVLTSRVGVAVPHTKPFTDRYYPGRFDKVVFSKNYALAGNGRSKADICVKEKADILIDDCLHYALDCQKKDIPVILFDRPWNRKRAMKEEGLHKLPSGIVRAKWDEIPELTDILKHDKKEFYRL